MASDIALALVGKIMEMTVDPVVRQFSYLFCYKQNIKSLTEQLAELEDKRVGVQRRKAAAGWNLETVDPTVESWLTKVEDIKNRAKEVDQGTSNVQKGCLNGWCPNLKHRYSLSRKATKLTPSIGKLNVEGNRYIKLVHEAPPPGIIPSEGPSSVSPANDGFKGFAMRIATMNEVMEALKDDGVNLIGISGMAGVGKTTLVNQVIEKVKAEKLFNEFAVSVVSQKPDLVKIQGEIAEMLGLKFIEGSIRARAVRLTERLKSRRVLVVLDDIWKGIDLGEVGIPAGNGCKVLFTTRDAHVYDEMAAQRHVVVQVLSNKEAWELFKEATGDCIENSDLCEIAKAVANECGGLPIAVVTLGKALSKKKKYVWADTLGRLKNSDMEEKVTSCIMQSYDFLESHRPNPQPLLLLCSLFGEDEIIPSEQLVKYAMGLKLFDGVETLEETRNRVHTSVNLLKDHNLGLQDDRDVDWCIRLHDVVRDVCLKITSNMKQAYLVPHDVNLKEWPQHNEQKAPTAIALESGELNELPGGLDYPNLRILQLKLKHENINIADNFFQGMREIQVFSFEGKRDRNGLVSGSNVVLPPTLQLLTNLQALSLESCNLGGDVSSIGCLKGLKILSFYNSQLDELPREIWKLKNLKMLDLRFSNKVTKIGNFVLSDMDQLEVLYLGNYTSWAENSTSIKELNSLSSLTALQLRVSDSTILRELEESFLEKLERFDISINMGYSCGEYGIIRNSISQGGDLSLLSDTKQHILVRKTQYLELKECEDEGRLLKKAGSARDAFQNLEILEINMMENLTEISQIPRLSFHKLQELRLINLRAIKHLWSGPIQPPSLGNLRVIDINTCHSLEFLFSSSMAICLVQLKQLHIWSCSELEGVISHDGDFEKIQFPKLTHLRLGKLESLKSLCQEPGNCGTVQSLLNQRVSFPNLDKIAIENLDTLKKVVSCGMQDGPTNKLRIMEVQVCKNLKNFVDSPTLQNLEDVVISDCESMEVVFDLKGLKVEGEIASFIFDKLTQIRLFRLVQLKYVWKMPPETIQGFRNLRTFEVDNCNKLIYLFTESMAKMLVNLQVLKVETCSNIVVIIEVDDEGCSNEPCPKKTIVFPQLKVLRLYDLHSFTSFCSSKYSFEFPLMDQVEIRRCPNMKKFCSGDVNAPVLKEPVEDPQKEEWIWEGHLNNSIYKAREENTKVSHAARPIGIISSEEPSVSPADDGFKGFATRIEDIKNKAMEVHQGTSNVVGKIVEKTVDPIVNTVVRQFSYIFCYKQNIQTLTDQLALLEARRDGVQLSTAEAERNLEIVDPIVKLWLTKVEDIKNKAMEVHGTSNVQKGCLNGWCPNLKHRYSLSRKARKLTVRIGKLKVEGNKDTKFSQAIGIISSEGPSVLPADDGFKGFATRIATMNEVMEALKDDGVNLIGISGMPGVGKTTLVNQVLEKVKAEKLFNEVAVSVVSQKPDLVKIQGEIAEMLGLTFHEGSIYARAERLTERLKKGGRVLVVLDDIWAGIDLDEVGIPGGNGCKVVFTTRTARACTEMAAQRHVVVQVLSDKEAWDLFREATGDCIENAELRDIAKAVANECGGLPIAVVTLGKALSKRNKYEWEDTLLKLKKSSGMGERVQSSIMLSYDSLKRRSPNAQQLLLLCSLFEEDENIPIEQLVKYALGLELFDDVETLEETRKGVQTLVNFLKDCNLVLRGDRDDRYVKLHDLRDDRYVKLHDIVRDVCLIITSNMEQAYLVQHDLKLKKWPRHNKQKAPFAIALKSGELNELPGGLDYPNLRILQLKLKHRNINIAKDFFEGMTGLQVFSFDGIRSNVVLPRTLKLLTNLQALSLKECNLVGDVSSIGCLKGLKILSFYNSQLDEFPREIWKLKNLKMLDLRFSKKRDIKIGNFVLSDMDQLEVLYLGNYTSWAENSTSITELNSLSSLTALQLCVKDSTILLELEESFLEKLERFDISINRGYSCGEYGIIRNSISQGGDLSLLSETKLHFLVRKTQYLNLDEMAIRELKTLEKVVSCGMQDGPANKLRSMEVWKCANLKNFVDSPTLQNLEDVEISNCKSMEVVFDLEGLKVVGENASFIFDKLTRIRLFGLVQLKYVWKMPLETIQGFRNLRTFEVDSCDELRYLFTESMAKMLVNLQVLKVEFCSNIVVIIEVDDEGCSNEPCPKKTIVFPQLKVLRLHDLYRFTSFCSSKYSFEFPLMDQVEIWRCPNMKTFCSEVVNAPVLKEPVEDPQREEWIWEGNLNNGIYKGKRNEEVEDEDESESEGREESTNDNTDDDDDDDGDDDGDDDYAKGKEERR